MNPIDFENYPQWAKDLHAEYMKQNLWRKINWYDFLKAVVEVKQEEESGEFCETCKEWNREHCLGQLSLF